MNQEEVAEYLRGISFFSELDHGTCLLLANEAIQVSRKADRVIVNDGDTLTSTYILRSGKAIYYFLLPDGKKSVVSHIDCNKPFGLVPAIMGSRHSGIIEIVEDAVVLCIPASCIKKLMSTNIGFSNQVARYAMDTVIRLTDLLKDLSFDAPARLSRYLFRRALESSIRFEEGIHFDLGLRKGVLADYLGITPETLSRLFAYLQNEGVITVKGSTIYVHSVKDLVRVSEGFYQS